MASRCLAERGGNTFFPNHWWWTWCDIIFQLINKCLCFGHLFLVLEDDVLWHSMNSEIDLKWFLLSHNIVFTTVSSNLFNTVVITLVPLPLQFPEASQITLLLLLLLLLIPSIFENYSWSWPGRRESLIQSRLTFLRYRALDTIKRHCPLSNDDIRFLFAKMLHLFLVPWPNESNGRPERVSTRSCSVLFSVSTCYLWIVLQSCFQNDLVEWRRQSVVLLGFLSPQWVPSPRLTSNWINILGEMRTVSNWKV